MVQLMVAKTHEGSRPSGEGESYRRGVCLDPVLNPAMNVEDLAKVLGTRRTATYDAIKRGDLDVPVIKVGRNWRVPTAAVRRLLELDPIGPEPQVLDEPTPQPTPRLRRAAPRK
jgi:excisionase family DNA binding protein